MSKKRTKKLKDEEPMPADVQAQADVLDLQTPPPAPDPDFKDPDREDVVAPTVEPPVEQMQLFDDNHQIVDELEHYRTEITDQIAKAYDAIAKKKIEIQLLEDKRFAVKEAIDMAMALLGKESPEPAKDVPAIDAASTPEAVPAAEGEVPAGDASAETPFDFPSETGAGA